MDTPLQEIEQDPQFLDCRNRSGQCELRTISAFQLGTILGLIVALSLLIIDSFRAAKGTKDPTSVAQFWVIFAITTLYYVLEEWVLEEGDFYRLRDLQLFRWGPNWRILPFIEFYIRVFIVLLLGFAAAGPPILMRYGFGVDQVDAGLICMVLIYDLFLLWDTLVILGDQVDMIWKVFWGDFIGAVVALVCLWSHQSDPFVGAIALLILFGVILRQLSRISWRQLLRRLGRRHYLR